MNENENEKKKNSWLPIVGGIALIIVLFIVVKLIFAMLAQVVPPERLNPEAFASQSQSQTQEQPAGDGQAAQGPAFCPFCGEEMTDSFQWGGSSVPSVEKRWSGDWAWPETGTGSCKIVTERKILWVSLTN